MNGIALSNGLITLPETDSDPELDSDPIPVVGSWDWNLNLTPCSLKISAWYNVVIGFGI